MNGKVHQFVKDHWSGLLGVTLVCIVVLYGIHSCRQSTTINVSTKGNRVRVECPTKHK